MRLLLAVLLAAPQAAAAARPDAAAAITKEQEQCDKLEQCFCIKDTPCGWCATYNRALVGKKSGPRGAYCPKWIAAPMDCPTLHCAGKEDESQWWIQCASVPLVCWVLWFIAYWWREFHYKQQPPVPEGESEVAGAGAASTGESPVQAEKQTTDFFRTKRTFEAFRKGMDCPPEERIPTSVSRPYELNLSHMSSKGDEDHENACVGEHRKRMTIKIALQWRSALGATLVDALGLMLLCAVWIALMRNLARRMDKDSYAWLALATKEIAAIVKPLQTATGLLLSFYALNRVAWYWSVLMEGHVLQGRCHDLSMIGGAVKRSTTEDWLARYTLYRHTMLTFFFTYQPYTPSLRFMGFGPLIGCGLLEAGEAEVLQRAHRSPGTVTESWLANWIATNLKDEARQQALHGLRELRASATRVQTLVDQRAPVSFESLLYVVIYALVVILPFAPPASIDYSDRPTTMDGFHIAAVLGVGILSAFYLALLHMLRHIQAPFDNIGSPNDALSPLALMNSTERKLRDYLTFPPSKANVGKTFKSTKK